MSGHVLKKISGDWFITKLFYGPMKRNHFYKDLYSAFGITDILGHPDMKNRLKLLEPRLEKEKLKLVIYDVFRPMEVQRYMYENASDELRPYIAKPLEPGEEGDMYHPRGVAIDCYLANKEGRELEFPSPPDAFYEGWEKDENYAASLKSCHRNFIDCPKEKIRNRQMLEDIMVEAGFIPYAEEWWHFDLPNADKYPVIYSLKDVKIE